MKWPSSVPSQYGTGTRKVNFSYFHLELMNAVIAYLARASEQSRISLVK